MKKLFGITTIVALMLSVILPIGAKSEVSAATTPAAFQCYNFDFPLHFGQLNAYKSLIAWSTSYNRWEETNTYNGYVNKFKAGTRALQAVLEKEGIAIAANEKGVDEIGPSTASAIVQLQNKYKDQILTPRGLSTGTGVVDEETRKFLNQKYGCIDKAVIDLTDPNGPTVRARGEVLAVKWNATKIPNTATLNINYVKSDGTATTSIATTTISNGKGSYNWTIPNTVAAGSYKIQLVISGSVKADASAKPFDIRETALEILSPNGGETLSYGQKVTVSWKTSALIKPTDTLTLRMVGTTASANASAPIYTLATVKNTGSYVWTVPDQIEGRIIANGNQYKMMLVSTGATSISDSSDASFTIAKYEKKLNLTAPVAGTSVMQGGTLALVWTSSNLTGNASVLVTGTNYSKEFGPVAVTAGKKDVELPLTLSPGSYTVAVSNKTGEVNASSSVAFTVTSKTRSLSVTAPNGGDNIVGVPSFNITWTANGIDTTVKKLTVNLIDTVSNRKTMLKEVATNVNSLAYTIPTNGIQGDIVGIGTYSDARYKVEVVAYGATNNSLFSDTSDTAFKITRNAASISITKPVTGFKAEIASALRVEWTLQNITVANRVTTVELVNASGVTSQVLSTNATYLSTKAVQQNLSASVVPGMYKIRISATLADGTPVQAESATFEVTAKLPTVTVTAPNLATVDLKTNKTATITWTIKNKPTNMNSYELYLVDTAASKTSRIGVAAQTSLSSLWNIPANGILGAGSTQITGIGDSNAKKYKIEIRMLDAGGITLASDQSDAAFSITR
jgi:hypothetical protein